VSSSTTAKAGNTTDQEGTVQEEIALGGAIGTTSSTPS
jgi:hypothetical protein